MLEKEYEGKCLFRNGNVKEDDSVMIKLDQEKTSRSLCQYVLSQIQK